MPMWLDRPDRPEANAPLSEKIETELLIIGAGFTGLWAALLAKEADPSLDVVLVEAGRVGEGASGRNGGFVSSTLSYYQGNKKLKLPESEPDLDELGRLNTKGLLATIQRYEMNVDYEPTGYLHMAIEPYQVELIKAMCDQDKINGAESIYLDKEAVQKEVASPVYLAGHWTKETRLGILHPGRLVDELRRVVCQLGVRLYEHTSLSGLSLHSPGPDLKLSSDGGEIRAKKVFIATNTYPSLVSESRKALVAPVWEYALATERLTDSQMSSIAWANRQGLSGVENFFHYYRLTSDNRIMIGGGSPSYFLNDPQPFSGGDDQSRFEAIASYVFKVFPQLEGLKFSHRWSGPIGLARDHAMHFGQTLNDRVVWVQGYTGQGITPSRFGARGGLALLGIGEKELANMAFVQRKPSDWPPHILRWLGAQLTFSALEKADKNEGKHGLWLKMLDKTGFGIDL